MILPSFPPLFDNVIAGPGTGEEPSGEILGPIQTASSERSFKNISPPGQAQLAKLGRRSDEKLSVGQVGMCRDSVI
jgi:hypothetical protein